MIFTDVYWRVALHPCIILFTYPTKQTSHGLLACEKLMSPSLINLSFATKFTTMHFSVRLDMEDITLAFPTLGFV